MRTWTRLHQTYNLIEKWELVINSQFTANCKFTDLYFPNLHVNSSCAHKD